MATFLETQTRLLREINRPSSETVTLASVKDAINDAILLLQRRRSWTYTEVIEDVAYPASDTLQTLANVPRSYGTVQQMNQAGDINGKPLKIMTYSQLEARRNMVMRRWPNGWEQQFWKTTLEEGYFGDMLLFISGMSYGLWPRPSTVTTIRVQYYKWLPALTADGDTNFFLTYAFDVVTTLALRRLAVTMKVTSNYGATDAEVEKALQSLELWDDSLRTTPQMGLQ